ncbi:MAG: hypothetical protein KGN01_07305 [Patescibacteria group bacterium]|nr:hypothetical protein [Patescibacteria group bacterium]
MTSLKKKIEYNILAASRRATLHEQHLHHVATAARNLRELGHKITGIAQSGKTPIGHAKSVIKHRSGKHKFTTTVRSKFNAEGKDHENKIETAPETE